MCWFDLIPKRRIDCCKHKLFKLEFYLLLLFHKCVKFYLVVCLSRDFKLDFLPKMKIHCIFGSIASANERILAHEPISSFFSFLARFDLKQHWINWNLFMPIRLEIIILISLCQRKRKNHRQKNMPHIYVCECCTLYRQIKTRTRYILICKSAEY